MRNTLTPNLLLAIMVSLFVHSGLAYADAALESKISNLTLEQKQQIKAIQKATMEAIRPLRGDLQREQRKLRRAESASDAATIAQQQRIIAPLQDEFRQKLIAEEDRIRELLNPDQTRQYEQWLAQRNAMVGSSRDVKILEE